MAQSKCPNPQCDSTNFELAPRIKPTHSTFELSFVQCAKCGAVIGVLESNNINKRLDGFAEIISKINVNLAMLQAKQR